MPKEYATKNPTPEPEIRYRRKKEKIAGYKCRTALVTYPNEDPIVVYYTRKIPANLNLKFEGLKGYPLNRYFQIEWVGEEKELSDELFSIPPDYRVMTMKEFQNSLGY